MKLTPIIVTYSHRATPPSNNRCTCSPEAHCKGQRVQDKCYPGGAGPLQGTCHHTVDDVEMSLKAMSVFGLQQETGAPGGDVIQAIKSRGITVTSVCVCERMCPLHYALSYPPMGIDVIKGIIALILLVSETIRILCYWS